MVSPGSSFFFQASSTYKTLDNSGTICFYQNHDRKKKNERKKQQKPSFSVAPTQVLELIATACIWVTCTLMNQSKQDQGMEGFHWPSHCHMPLKELGSGISLSQTSQTKGGDPQGRIIFIEHLPCARHCAQLWRAP